MFVKLVDEPMNVFDVPDGVSHVKLRLSSLPTLIGILVIGGKLFSNNISCIFCLSKLICVFIFCKTYFGTDVVFFGGVLNGFGPENPVVSGGGTYLGLETGTGGDSFIFCTSSIFCITGVFIKPDGLG